MSEPGHPPRKTPRAGGAIIAGATIAGTILGAALGQPSLGVIGGFAIGTIAAILIWLNDRRG